MTRTAEFSKPVKRKAITPAMKVNCLLERFLPLGALACGVCGEPLKPGQQIQFDHVHGHAMGGPHEYQNLRPIHYDPCHKAKSKKDVAALAKVDRILGLTCNGPKKQIQSRGFDKTRTRKFSGAVVTRVA